MKSPRLTKNSSNDYDLKLENGKVPWVEDGAQAAQHACERLLIFKGELSLNGALTENTEGGTRWYEVIFAMDKDREEKEMEIKRRILATPGVDKILSFTWTQSGRTVTIEGRIKTEWGEEDISEEFTPL
ncbi:MAG: hypothetical protein GWN96_06470 [candidate division Zixibacteria bacterium]|nr:hypothetical protein [candidate division Zixibacteria bacterium]